MDIQPGPCGGPRESGRAKRAAVLVHEKPTGSRSARKRSLSVKFSLAILLAGLGLVEQPGWAAVSGPPDFDVPEAQLVDDLRIVIEREFERYDSDYRAQFRKFESRLQAAQKRLHDAARTGNAMDCSTQIAREAKWLLTHTAHWTRLAATMDRLEASLAVEDQDFALKQSSVDGAWGVCYREWFLKLDATIDALSDLQARGEVPRYPLTFLEQVDDVDKLTRTVQQLLVSDVAATGMDHRDELNELTESMAQLLFKPELKAYVVEKVRGFEITDRMVDRYRQFLDRWQDAGNGYWSALYRVGGKIYRSHDLSMTYHLVSYREGRVNHWPEIIDTTLAIKRFEYPYGWMARDGYNDHNNYDIAKIFRYGWPHMGTSQRERVSREIDAMVDWCLTSSVKADGSIRSDPEFYESLDDHYYFALSFLDIVGYWDPAKRFWSSRRFPGARHLCESFKETLQRLVHDSWSARAAMERLPADCASVP